MSSMKDDIPFEQKDSSASRSPQVKSNAVLKYSAVTSPATFATLQSDTNINNPPSNWLKSYSDIYGLNYAFPRNAGFTSFRMANMFLECVGQVDVVSGSENVKNLLKMPYSGEMVSMMVHRVGNSLLIDEFDIHKHLRSGVANDWSWLRKFYFEYVLAKAPEDKTALSPLDRTRNSLLEQSLESKFLHYSLAESEEDLNIYNAPPAPLPITSGPALPEPLLEEGLPDSKNYKYTRNVVWSFEDIRMLLGTDMPIFGGPTRPCISLRLRDASKPINVLTGIDYWLDNLMSNVPEVVMCYHLDGIVQKYELIKTEDLPYLPESKFSPKLIRDVAQNILSFLKSNATKAGHTYWLFKGKNDDAVKLYDLTSLCSDTLEDKGQNPFTVPVGMLLYRVARNMKANGDESQLATIRVLLKNCLTLLDKEKYPEIVTSAHFILSDVYVPCDTDPCSPQLLVLPDSDKNSNKEEDEDDSDPGLTSVPVNDLCISKFSHKNNYSPPPITSGLEERSNLALQHVKEGLDCLQYFEKYEQEHAAKKENEPKMAKPNEPIPMPYCKLSREKPLKKKKSEDLDLEHEENKEDNSLKALLCWKRNETMPTWQKPDKADIDSWKVHLGLLLTNKACLVYSILAEKEMETQKYWSALKHIAGVLRCCEENKGLVALMLAKAADCLFCIVSFQQNDTDEDSFPVIERPEGSLYDEEIELFSNVGEGNENRLIASVKCYQRSLNLYYSVETMKKLGNTCNILNSHYTAQALNYISQGVFNEEINYAVKEGEKYLKIGLENFYKVGDKTNYALLMSNLGQLNRIKAHSMSFKEHSINNLFKQKQFYKKAIESYSEGIKHMESRKLDPNVWDALHWQMSCTYLNFETLLQERAPPLGSKDRVDYEREMVNILHQALEACDLKNTESKNYSIYQYRAAVLHHKLAVLHRSSLQALTDASKKPQLLRLINNHYAKAYFLLMQLQTTSSSIDILKVQFERIELEELFAESAKKKKKHYLECLNLALQCKPALELIECEKKSDKADGKEQDPEEAEDEKKMLKKLLEKLQFLLKTLVKILSSEKQDVNSLKKVYASSLKKSDSETDIFHLIKLLDMASSFMTEQNF